MIRPLSGFLEAYDDTPVDKSSLSSIFEEEPVSLKVFIKDKKYLGQSNINLSEVQENAIRHIERVYNPDLYARMGKEFSSSYWSEAIPMTNLITLQWGKLAGARMQCAGGHHSGLLISYCA